MMATGYGRLTCFVMQRNFQVSALKGIGGRLCQILSGGGGHGLLFFLCNTS